MINVINDKPILKIEEDKLSRKDFSTSIADIILSQPKNECFTLAINGKWGSGKTSVLNMTKQIIKQSTEIDFIPVVVDFAPWNVLDENALIGQFFDCLSDKLTKNYVKKIILNKHRANILKLFAQLPKIGPFFNILNELLDKYEQCFVGDKKNLLYIKDKIHKKLENSPYRFIVFIDDLDRLNQTEIKLLIQLIKAVCDFPNVTYVLAFDREIVANALSNEQNVDGHKYLEKIIQLSIDMPQIEYDYVADHLSNQISNIINSNEVKIDKDRLNLFVTHGFLNYFTNLRDIYRYANILSMKYQYFSNEIDFVDLLVIEAIALFEPELFEFIYSRSNDICWHEFPALAKTDNNSILEECKKISNNYRFVEMLFPKINCSEDTIIYINTNQAKINNNLCYNSNFLRYITGCFNKNLLTSNQARFILTIDDENKREQLINDLNDTAYNSFVKFVLCCIRELKYIEEVKHIIPQLLSSNLSHGNISGLFIVPNYSVCQSIIIEIVKQLQNDEAKSWISNLYESSYDFETLIVTIFSLAEGTHYYNSAENKSPLFTYEYIDFLHNMLVKRISNVLTEQKYRHDNQLIDMLQFLTIKNEDTVLTWYQNLGEDIFKIQNLLVKVGDTYSSTQHWKTYNFCHNIFDPYCGNLADRDKTVDYIKYKNLCGDNQDLLGNILYLMPVKEDGYSYEEISEFCRKEGYILDRNCE